MEYTFCPMECLQMFLYSKINLVCGLHGVLEENLPYITLFTQYSYLFRAGTKPFWIRSIATWLFCNKQKNCRSNEISILPNADILTSIKNSEDQWYWIYKKIADTASSPRRNKGTPYFQVCFFFVFFFPSRIQSIREFHP